MGVYDQTSYEKLIAEENPFDLMKIIALTDYDMRKIEERYNQQWVQMDFQIRRSYTEKYKDIEDLKPEIWETDSEFINRQRQLIEQLDKELDIYVSKSKTSFYSSLMAEIAPIQKQQNLVSKKLEIVQAEQGIISLIPEAYQRNEKQWPFSFSYQNSLFAIEDLP